MIKINLITAFKLSGNEYTCIYEINEKGKHSELKDLSIAIVNNKIENVGLEVNYSTLPIGSKNVLSEWQEEFIKKLESFIATVEVVGLN